MYITFTDQEQIIVAESCWAFTTEAANLVNANTICTNSWDLFTFINICKTSTQGKNVAV